MTSWLQNDESLFWISGKPGSGKSTFIKYLHTNPLTSNYLRNWYRSDNCVQATFFFHYRGTAIQKSLEGLYRGILSQILEQAPRSLFAIQPNLSQSYGDAVRNHKLGTLSADLAALVSKCEITQDDEVSQQLHDVLLCEMPRKAFRTMVIEPVQASGAIGDDADILEQMCQRRDHIQPTFRYATNIAHANDEEDENASSSLDLYISKRLVFSQDMTNQQKRGFVNVDLLISKNTCSFAKFTLKGNKNIFATLDLFISQKRAYTTDIIYDENKDILAEVEVLLSKTLQYSTIVGKDYFSSRSTHKWPKEKRVASKIQDWLIAIDPIAQFSLLKRLLEDRTKQHKQHEVDKLVKEALVRFLNRKSQQQRIEAAHWSQKQLSDAMDRVASQRLIDLDLCLLLDALDEHDGPPEVISQFIKRFTTAEESRTRMKILFSSRPWQPFIDAFGQNSGFQIHDFTEDDIRGLCLQKTISDEPGSVEVLELTEQIVKQARGVFLWAKLVLSDLLENAARLSVSGYSTDQLHAALIDILNSLPNDLEQYYKLIITRIPSSYRWEAYCLLEVISKSADAISLSQVSDILACARANSVGDLLTLRKARSRDVAHRYSNGELRAHSGGLIEAVHSNQLQLLHQTLIEFVQLPEFKSLVLEDRYRITKENGYSILMKYTIFKDKLLQNELHHIGLPVMTVSNKAIHYARQAEFTTGKSAFAIFKDVAWQPPGGDYLNFLPKNGDEKYTTLEIAIAYGLELLFGDVLKRNARVNPDRAPLMFLLLRNMVQWGRIDSASAVNTLQDMVTQGFPIHNSHIGFLTVLNNVHMFRASSREESIMRATRVIAFCQEVLDTFFEPNFSFACQMGGLAVEEVARFGGSMRLRGIKDTAQAIHISSHYVITRHLLESGANANELTTEGLTPIDCWVKDTAGYGFSRGSRHVVSSITVLIEHGGRLNVCTRKEWNHLEEFLSTASHLNIPQCPGWLDGAPGASRGIDIGIRDVKRRSGNLLKLWKRK